MNTISLSAIQTRQDAWTLIKFFEVTENAKTKRTRVQASHPLTKLLTKIRNKCPWASKM